jgi:hypothetical protein
VQNAFDEITQAISQAKEINRVCDQYTNTLVGLVEGRLRNVSPYRLIRLKRELAQFNAATKRWKD